jgi:hypothetical protein
LTVGARRTNVKRIGLTKGFSTIVDDEDYEFLSHYKWHYNSGYAKRSQGVVGNRKLAYMSRYIMLPEENQEVDHINGDPLDNRRENMRICNHEDNLRNITSNRGRSKYKGVYFRNGKWVAHIMYQRVNLSLRQWDSEEDAAHAYDAAACWFFGEFSKTNF